MRNNEKNIAIIGFGKLGSALYYELKSYGYTVNTIIEKNSVTYNKIIKINRNLKVYKGINSANFDKSDVLILSVKDSQLEHIVKEINEKRINCRDKIIFHTSGAKSSNILKIRGLWQKTGVLFILYKLSIPKALIIRDCYPVFLLELKEERSF